MSEKQTEFQYISNINCKNVRVIFSDPLIMLLTYFGNVVLEMPEILVSA